MNLARAVRISGDGGQERRHLAKKGVQATYNTIFKTTHSNVPDKSIFHSVSAFVAILIPRSEAPSGEHHRRPRAEERPGLWRRTWSAKGDGGISQIWVRGKCRRKELVITY